MDWLHNTAIDSMEPKENNHLKSIFLIGLMCAPTAALAEFVLDFTPDNSGTIGTSIVRGGSTIGGQTPFLMSGILPEVVFDPETGQAYYHMIIGDPADGFAMEVYIERGFTNWQGGPGSAVGGAGGGGGGNGTDPLDITTITTANGEANPTKVIMRMILNDSEMQQEFVKGKFNFKPVITQSLNAKEISAQFSIDMSMYTYSDNLVPGIISNTMQITDVNDLSFVSDFDIANPCEFGCTNLSSSVTAGRYTYSTGGGPGGSAGTYTYSDGDFNPGNVNWENYYDSSDPSNVWSYTTNQPP